VVIVIADAGPLIALAKIDQLQLLAKLFSKVTITQSVADECLRNPTADSLLIKQALADSWLQSVANPVFKHPLSRSLGIGEQSSIELALQSSNKTLLILDDFLARKQALHNQLDMIGSAAILFAAQNKGFIDDAERVIAQLNHIGYRISAEVVKQLKNGMS
jgi:predicted nucleic acid-binding protein